MESLFNSEDAILEKGEALLREGAFSTEADAVRYGALLEEYRKMLRQLTRMVKVSDLMQLEQKKLSERLEAVSNSDVLTGLYNRRYFNEVFHREWESASRNGTTLSILMFDIDYFKKYNDTYGHLQGDECLKTVSHAIAEAVRRPRDVVTRFGGEEFVVLLPETAAEGALTMAEAIVAKVAALGLPHEGSGPGAIVTVSSGGSTCLPGHGIREDDLLKQMDCALYQAKAEGRNCARLVT